MQTLGITDKQQEPDNIFRRIFWPSNHAADVDSLGQQGLWVCVFVAVVSVLQTAIQGHWFIGLVFALIFFLGGIGVREHSRAAAILVSALYLLNLVAGVILGQAFPGFATLGILCLLLANIRGTWIAARWQAVAETDAFPERMRQSWRDQFVDIMPRRVWPTGKYFFFTLYTLMFVLTLVGILLGGATRKPAHNSNTQVITIKSPG